MSPINAILMQSALTLSLGALAINSWVDGVTWLAALEAFASATNLLAVVGRIAIYPRSPGAS